MTVWKCTRGAPVWDVRTVRFGHCRLLSCSDPSAVTNSPYETESPPLGLVSLPMCRRPVVAYECLPTIDTPKSRLRLRKGRSQGGILLLGEDSGLACFTRQHRLKCNRTLTVFMVVSYLNSWRYTGCVPLKDQASWLKCSLACGAISSTLLHVHM